MHIYKGICTFIQKKPWSNEIVSVGSSFFLQEVSGWLMNVAGIKEEEEADVNTNMVFTRAEIAVFLNFLIFFLFTQPK